MRSDFFRGIVQRKAAIIYRLFLCYFCCYSYYCWFILDAFHDTSRNKVPSEREWIKMDSDF